MTTAVWNGSIVARSDKVLRVEFAVYFPLDSVIPGTLRPSATPPTYCHWKGIAKYFDVHAGGETHEGAAWTYPDPYAEANAVRGHVAFWKGVQAQEVPDQDPLTDPGGPRGDRQGHEALCWLLVRTQQTSLDPDEINGQTGLRGAALSTAFQHPFVQPYIVRYKWRLVDGALVQG